MRRILVLASLVVLVMVGGCAKSQWAPTGGSRADATVDISYEGGMGYLDPDNGEEAYQMAIQRCKAWGYADAEAFGGVTRVKNGDYYYIVTKKFQCIGQGVETEHKK